MWIFFHDELYVVTTNVFPSKGMVLGSGSSSAEALVLPRVSGEPIRPR
jgi:hypothetical protein